MGLSKSLIVSSATATLAWSSLPAQASPTGFVFTGPGEGATREVRRFEVPGLTSTAALFPYGPSLPGGVRVAVGDVTGDGYPDLLTGTGGDAPAGGGGPHVKVFDGSSLLEVRSFFSHPGFTGGVYVAAGDINGDGRADIVTGADGGGGLVRAFNAVNNAEIRSFNPFGTTFTGGVTVAAGDVNGDGRDDIIAAPSGGSGGGPNVRVFSGADNSTLHNFFATTPSFTGGVFVASGDVNGDGRADIIAGLEGGGLVNVFSGTNLAPLRSFQPFGAGFTGGVRVASGDVNGDGFDDVITGAGTGAGGHVRVFDGATMGEIGSFFAYDSGFTGGVHVAAAAVPEPATGAMALGVCGVLLRRSTDRRRGGSPAR